MKVNTSSGIEQANVVNTTLLFNAIRQQLGDIEAQAYTTGALSEMASEKLEVISDASGDKLVLEAVIHLDALVVAIRRSIEVIRDAIPAISLALTDAEGGAA